MAKITDVRPMGELRASDELTLAEGVALGKQWPKAWEGRLCAAGSGRIFRWPYACSRNQHDAGPHVAHVAGGSAVAIWPSGDGL